MDIMAPAVPRFGQCARKATWITALLVATSCFGNGCGTVRNLASGDPDIYGGTQKDVKLVMTPGALRNSGNPVGITVGPILAAAVVADVGLSAVADTVTLPLVIGMRQNKNGSNESRDAAGSTTGSPQGNP
jgi:uncharacterized protein YceK